MPRPDGPVHRRVPCLLPEGETTLYCCCGPDNHDADAIPIHLSTRPQQLSAETGCAVVEAVKTPQASLTGLVSSGNAK